MEQQRYIAELEAKLALYAHLVEAEDDLKLGRSRSLEDTKRELLREIETLPL